MGHSHATIVIILVRTMADLQVVRALIKLGIVVSTSDLVPVRRSIAYFLDNFERQTREQETIGVRMRPLLEAKSL